MDTVTEHNVGTRGTSASASIAVRNEAMALRELQAPHSLCRSAKKLESIERGLRNVHESPVLRSDAFQCLKEALWS